MTDPTRDDRLRPTGDDHGPGAEGVHEHPHRHEPDGPAHAHPHHHGTVPAELAAPPLVHDHVHGLSFERYTYICSPIHELDPRAKIVATLAIVLAVVLSPPPRGLELAGIALFLVAAATIAHVPLGWVLRRSALVLPFAGMIALFAPLQQSGGSLSVGGLAGAYSHGGWMAAYSILAKAWLSTLTVVVLSATTPVPRLFRGLERMRVPDVILTLLSFMYRYVSVLRTQIASLRNALDSRGFGLGRLGRLRLYGNLAGAMFVRAYERGERVYGAMLSRGYDGSLPSSETLTWRGADSLTLATVLLGVAALALY
jgi:cobalt/nickel transport system permease protein